MNDPGMNILLAKMLSKNASNSMDDFSLKDTNELGTPVRKNDNTTKRAFLIVVLLVAVGAFTMHQPTIKDSKTVTTANSYDIVKTAPGVL